MTYASSRIKTKRTPGAPSSQALPACVAAATCCALTNKSVLMDR
ncbi:hypothetical protein PC129_g21745 [Phytophthora cactorum]|uniref:Uncharacterized protein n=1 Tax=Phytophthora cactorum TaxID=29920 RepID=A0A329S5P4_9STRA|nr:hypothetical protein PC112_g22373 [Phytophthora cactorum]KAG2822797.1 hypothetical protein PC113_g22281 [Phytophthora cactorum]KAG2824587.1 hypothetical protein PC111_g9776 [Phytophthora cactorum]KAG2874995.1 hypothetical protein PC114_g24964 [Phytophthora cactorum]KAG2881651.1 hypothetical protein PC115_g22163 [Phytophthora cactorum]